jgi:hypothetical protein
MPFGLKLLSVAQYIGKKHAAVAPHLAAGDGVLIKELYQVGSGDIQEVSGLLGRELGTKRS